MRPRILIVDDHEALRMELQRLLAQEFSGAEFGFAATPAEALANAATGWQVVILDLSLCGAKGFQLIRELVACNPLGRIVVHTMHSEQQLGALAREAGADAFVSKDRPVEELCAAIRHAMRGGAA